MSAQFRLPEAEYLFARKVRQLDADGTHARPFKACRGCAHQPGVAA